MTAKEDKLQAFCGVLREYMTEIQRIVQKNPDKNTDRIVSLTKLVLHMTE